MRKLGAAVLGIILVVGLTAACGSDSKDDNGAASTTTAAGTSSSAVTVKGSEYSFDAPAKISGGRVDLTIDNVGKEEHQAIAMKLTPGKTPAELAAFYANPAAASGPPPGFTVAGVTGVKPGGKASVSFKAEPGEYVWVCFLPAADGVPHLAKGMAKPFTVEGDNGKSVEAASTVVNAVDYKYENVPTFKPGQSTFTLTNKGTQDHEAGVIELADGKTLDDVKAYFAQQHPTGPPPISGVGGGAVAKDGSVSIDVDLSSGKKYAFICGIPDQKDGQPHFTKGMLTEIKVS